MRKFFVRLDRLRRSSQTCHILKYFRMAGSLTRREGTLSSRRSLGPPVSTEPDSRLSLTQGLSTKKNNSSVPAENLFGVATPQDDGHTPYWSPSVGPEERQSRPKFFCGGALKVVVALVTLRLERVPLKKIFCGRVPKSYGRFGRPSGCRPHSALVALREGTPPKEIDADQKSHPHWSPSGRPEERQSRPKIFARQTAKSCVRFGHPNLP